MSVNPIEHALTSENASRYPLVLLLATSVGTVSSRGSPEAHRQSYMQKCMLCLHMHYLIFLVALLYTGLENKV